MNALGADPGALFQPANQQGHQRIGLLQFSDLPSLALRLRGYLFITWWMWSHSKAQASHPEGATSEARTRRVSPTWPLSSTQLLQKHFGSRRPSFTASYPALPQSWIRERHRTQLSLSTSRLSGTREGKYWNGSRVNICQHEKVVQPKGQDSTFVKSKPNPRNSNFNLWTSELILVHWLRMSRLFGNLFASG